MFKQTLAALGFSLGAMSYVSAAQADQPTEVIIPGLEANDRRYDYPLQLLELALQKAEFDYTLVTKKEPSSHERMSQLMRDSGAWSVGFFGARADYEEELRPIYFPLYRGLLGNRIAITHKDNAERFDQISTYDDFMNLSICQGIGWSDTEILQAAGFNVVTGKYENLFKLAHAKRCDAYTRAVFEPYAEVEGHAAELPNLTVDDSILIRYRLPYFMYIDPAQEDLAKAIERGLEIAMSDGSFQALFEASPTIAEAKSKVNEAERVCIEVDNPFLSENVRAIPDELWQGFSFGAGDAVSGGCELVSP